MRRMLTATLTAAALVCSGSVVGAQEGEAPASLVQQVITAAEESLGSESTVAVLRAYDRGYDLLQILEGLIGSTLAADGTITDEEGAPVAPTSAPAGVIEGDDTGGPAGGASRAVGPTSGEQIAIELLETGVQKTSKRLDKQNDLGERAEEYDASLDIFTMLAVLVLIDDGYSPEQIIIDGLIEKRIDIGFDGSIVILDEKGRVLRPGGDEPSFGDDVDTASVVSTLIDDLSDAISGEDPLAAADDSFKRQFTLTIDVDLTDDEGVNGTIEGKVNFGARKGEPGRLSGRGTGTLKIEGACSLSEFDTTEYPYTVNTPLRIGVAGQEDGGKATLGIAVVATSAAQVTADGDTLCLEVVRDTADVYPSLLSIPEVNVRLRDGTTANADNQDSGQPFTVGVAVQVKEI